MPIKVSYLTKTRRDAVGAIDKELKERFKNQGEVESTFLQLPYNYTDNLIRRVKNILVALPKLLRAYASGDLVHYSAPDNYFLFWHPWLRIIFGRVSLLGIQHLEKPQNLLEKLQLWIVQHFFDHYVAISQFSKDQLTALGIPESRVSVVTLGVKNNFYHERGSPAPLPFPYLLYVGDEYPRKNLLILLEAFRKVQQNFPKLKLVKVGLVKDADHAQRVDKKIQNLNLSKNILLRREYLKTRQLRRLYSHTEILICPATLEGFNLTIPEAMRCQCLVLASQISAHEEFELPTQLYVDEIENPDAWSKKITEVLELPMSKKTDLKEELYRSSLSYNWDDTAAKISAVYQKLYHAK